MNLLKFYFKNLIRFKVLSAITIGSFAVSLAIVVILASFISSELAYDKHIPHLDRLYRVVNFGDRTNVPEEARLLLLETLPEIEEATNYVVYSAPIVFNRETFSAKIIHSDEGFFSVFQTEFVRGTAEGIFSDKRQVVITQSLATKVFGNEDPIGMVLSVSHREEFVVAGVINDFQPKSSLNGDIICSAELKLAYSSSCNYDGCTYFYNLLLRINPKSNVEALNSRLNEIIPEAVNEAEADYSLSPFKSAYFDIKTHFDGLEHANVKLINLLVWLTLALLILSVFNYVSLTTAQSLYRLKEYGVKKVLGLGKIQLFIQCLAEAFITTLVSFGIAIYVALFLKPMFEGIFNKAFSLDYLLTSPKLLLACFVGLILIALISAIFPASIALKVQTRDLLVKQVSTKSKGFDFRKILIVIQFAATIAIISSLLLVTRQVNFVKNKDYGFNTDELVIIPVHGRAKEKVGILIDRLESKPSVISACYSHGIPGEVMFFPAHQEVGEFFAFRSDKHFVETFGIEVVDGRNFFAQESRPVCLINRRGMIQADWDDFVGKTLFGYEVVGVVEDFHFQNMYHQIGALMITLDNYVSHIVVRLEPYNTANSISQIKQIFEEVLPDFEFSHRFYNDYLTNMYLQEEKRAISLRIVALIAIFISCIGLFGIAAFVIKQRTKEIGIRKVNGATSYQIVSMLNQNTVKWVAIAFVIATPIAYFAMDKWLQNFAYRTPLSWWVFALAGLLALAIALLTVSWQSWRAARRNPVEALRYE
ncbi:MAG: ABC transporter permease [Tenuifilaceae bacterium]|jgi:putative ABC transport system permease protein|nr:ABC transporter permease [Tenuifilaceae bacterium]